MKRFSKILICLICLLGFTTKINAANYSDSITTYVSSTKLEYVNGLSVYYNRAGSYNIYSLDANTYFNNNTYLYNPIEADKGYAYIINNSNVTNDTYKNYYIANVAILWYEDYLNGNNQNISSALKDVIKSKTNDTICYYITKLVNNAKNYNKSGNLITFVTDEITFSKNGSYYYSNIIEVNVNGLNSTPSVSFYNAPTGTSVINNNITNNGTGTFQIRIPVSSLNNTNDRDFVVNVTGTGYNYNYYKYNNGINTVIYGRSYTSNYSNQEASMIAKIDKTSNSNTIVKINIVNENGYYINGLTYRIYEGNCATSSCANKELVSTFTTTKTFITLDNILKEGVYTLERVTDTNYQIPKKQTISVSNSNYVQEFTIDENDYINNDEYNNDSYNVRILSDLNDSANIIKVIDDSNDKIVHSFRSNESYVDVTLTPGLYCILDTENTMEIFFEITEKGLLYVHENGEKVKRDSINIQDYLIRYTQDEVSNEENIHYDENGNIHIDNLDGIESIDISQNVETTTTVEWLSNLIDCPITSLSSTIKYIVGAIILSTGIFMVVKNVKKNKNNI